MNKQSGPQNVSLSLVFVVRNKFYSLTYSSKHFSMSWQGIWNAILAQIYAKDVIIFREIKLEDLDDNHVLCVFRNVLSIVLTYIKYAVCNKLLFIVVIWLVSYFMIVCVLT